MRWTIGYVLLLAAGMAASTKDQRTVTTKPATTRLSVPELLALADVALSMEKPVKGCDRYWLVAVALVESGGDPSAVGDGGRAIGLHQFHLPAWADCWKGKLGNRYDPMDSFRAAIRYAGKTNFKWLAKPLRADDRRACLSNHHHLGHIDLNDERYISRVERRYQQLVKEYETND